MSLIPDLSIRSKLLCAFVALVVVTAGMGIVSFRVNSEINTDISQIRQAALERAEGISAMAEALLAMNSSWQELAVGSSEAPNSVLPNAGQVTSTTLTQRLSDAIRKFQEQGLTVCRADTIKAIAIAREQGYLDEIQRAEEELPMLQEIETQFVALKKDLEEHFTGNDASLAPIGREKRHLEELERLSSLVNGFDAHVKDQLRRETENIQRSVRHANITLFSFDLLAVFTGCALTVLTWRMISHPIGVLKESAERIGKGDLRTRVELPTHDEFGLLAQTFNQMMQELSATTVSRDYVDRILKSMVNALIVLRPDRSIESMNDATLKLLGYSSNELMGMSMDSILKSPSTRQTPILDEAASQGSVSEADAHYQTKDGRLIPVTVSASVLSSTARVASGIVCVAQDISARNRAEEELAQANRDLLESSRQAGMAEVATSVLHNVGNVLNSVNVSSAIISEKVQKSKITNLSRAIALIEEHENDLSSYLGADPKGKQLPGYLSKLTVNLMHEQKEILEEASALAGNVLHIREIISTQQNYAKVSGITELLSPRDLMEDAVRINKGSLERHQVKLIREYEELPPIPMQKHQVLQILVNLLRNAKHACDDSERSDKQITLGLALEKGRIRMSVSDNGVGIPEENLSRIFAHGFTTRKEGHGFGLHSGALMAKEMGGTLIAFSKGLGQGATFTLELPTSSNSHEN